MTGQQNESDLSDFTTRFTICTVGCFVFVAICGHIDAKFLRRNEIFSAAGIMSSATYTVDIVSGVTICNENKSR